MTPADTASRRRKSTGPARRARAIETSTANASAAQACARARARNADAAAEPSSRTRVASGRAFLSSHGTLKVAGGPAANARCRRRVRSEVPACRDAAVALREQVFGAHRAGADLENERRDAGAGARHRRRSVREGSSGYRETGPAAEPGSGKISASAGVPVQDSKRPSRTAPAPSRRAASSGGSPARADSGPSSLARRAVLFASWRTNGQPLLEDGGPCFQPEARGRWRSPRFEACGELPCEKDENGRE